jgi:hypothetical protein
MSGSFPPPPETRARRSKSVWKRWWFWAIAFVVVLVAAAAASSPKTKLTVAEQASPSPETAASTISPTSSPLEMTRVPNVTGKSVDAAMSKMQAAGFTVTAETKLTNAAPAGRVLAQSPRAGSRIEVGDTITLTVAKALPRIPNVVGRTLRKAKRALQRAGFDVGKMTQETSSQPKGMVVSQSPNAGTLARPGRAVSLVIAKPATQPSNNCTPGYSPCLAPASDYDCAGGSGDGPKYVYGTVRVTGSDPYGLDADGDGYGCE